MSDNGDGAKASAQRTTTLANLQTAFNGESNARARYLAFAVAAEREGYGPVASLFRAAARAEQIHAANHAAVIRKHGAEPVANIQTPAVKSTRENLAVAIEGEEYERDVMYPTFLQQARDERDQSGAVRTFHLAQKAEAEHAALYRAALSELETLQGPARKYFVCPVCGFTTSAPADARCPLCSTPRERYEEIS